MWFYIFLLAVQIVAVVGYLYFDRQETKAHHARMEKMRSEHYARYGCRHW